MRITMWVADPESPDGLSRLGSYRAHQLPSPGDTITTGARTFRVTNTVWGMVPQGGGEHELVRADLTLSEMVGGER